MPDPGRVMEDNFSGFVAETVKSIRRAKKTAKSVVHGFRTGRNRKGSPNRRRTREWPRLGSGYENPRFDSELNQVGACLQVELFHDAVFVKCHCARGHVEDTSDFLHGFSLGQ